MNAVYLLGPRLIHAKRWGKETLKGGGLDNHQFNDYISDGPLSTLFEKPDTVWTPRVLKDGSDSVGALGALNRVYLNIGTFSEDWLTHFNALIGGKPITPLTIAGARKNSAYFKATEAQTLHLANASSRPPARTISRMRRRSEISHDRRKSPDAREGRVRGELRAMPLEQAAHAGTEPRPAGCAARTTCSVSTTTGAGRRRPSSRRRCAISSRRPTSCRTTICPQNSGFR
jgi:hypothetical protein